MKITKLTVFLIAFLMSSALVQLSTNKTTSPTIDRIAENTLAVPEKVEINKEANELIEENNDWENRDENNLKNKLLETGEGFHGKEIQARTGEKWLGLFRQNNEYFLRASKIQVRRAYDAVVDEPGEKTGKSVSVNEKAEVLFLLKNANKLTEGEVATLYDGILFDESENQQEVENISLRTGFAKEFKNGDVSYTLRVKKGKNKNQENIIALVLEGNGISQTLHSLEAFDDYLGELEWAGDLDRDGKPDFYFNLYFNENVEYKNLFLSSSAEKGKLVKKVAIFITTGC